MHLKTHVASYAIIIIELRIERSAFCLEKYHDDQENSEKARS